MTQLFVFFNFFEILQDPFDMKIRKRAKGTKEEPTIIPSIYHYRLVGCIC